MPKQDPYLRYAGLGVEILVAMLLCAGGGYLADQYLGTKTPWFLLLGCFLGIVYVISTIIRKTKS